MKYVLQPSTVLSYMFSQEKYNKHILSYLLFIICKQAEADMNILLINKQCKDMQHHAVRMRMLCP
jgi:hypothetical protein